MEYRRQRGAIEAEDGYFYEDVARPVFVRLVSEDLKTLTVEDNRVAFEAKYGFVVNENVLEDVFFCLMLADAAAGQDPNQGVLDALRYYRGNGSPDLFGEKSPVSGAIRQEPFRTVLEMLNAGLEKVRPIVWWSVAKKRASLGLFCPNAHTALYAMALNGMGLAGGLGVCQRCGTAFHRSRRTQRFCTHRCQLTASMRRFRERHAKARNRTKRKKSQGQKSGRRKKL